MHVVYWAIVQIMLPYPTFVLLSLRYAGIVQEHSYKFAMGYVVYYDRSTLLVHLVFLLIFTIYTHLQSCTASLVKGHLW